MYFLYSLCLQLSLIATCCIHGSKQERFYTVDVGNVSAIDTLNFTFYIKFYKGTSDESGMKEDVVKACGLITWLGDLQNMWQRTVLRCNNSGSQPAGELYDYFYNCTPTGGKVCRNSKTTNSTSCGGHTGGSKVLALTYERKKTELSNRASILLIIINLAYYYKGYQFILEQKVLLR